jgi:hypothetical protein
LNRDNEAAGINQTRSPTPSNLSSWTLFNEYIQFLENSTDSFRIQFLPGDFGGRCNSREHFFRALVHDKRIALVNLVGH